MKYLCLLSAIILLFSCDKNECCLPESTAMDLQIIINVINYNGDNMFNPSTNNGFNIENVRFYKLIKNKTTIIENSNWDYPYGYRTDSNSNGDIYIQTTGLFPEPNVNFAEYIIEISNTEKDTLKCKVEKFTNVLRFTKIWVNDELKWDIASKTERKINIIVN
tara:strand:- start:13944 stop:14432 length:489 start_codon:yes stop_codon:yes gene_type:complete